MEIREVRPEEHEEAGRITRLAYEEFGAEGWSDGYADRLADIAGRADRTTVLVAVEDGRILGTSTLELDGRVEGGYPRPPLRPGEAHVRMLGVAPDARGRGVGRALMEACIARARDAGKTFLSLHTTEEMTAARTMYADLGFRRMPDLTYPSGFTLLAYERAL